MLPERYRELLTAYVDGELSARQRRHVLRLLRRSVEARRLLHFLQSDSHNLIHLPRVPLDRDVSGPVLEKIAAQPLPLRRRRPPAAVRAFPAWVGVAAAAAVLLAVGTASYFFFASSLDHASPPVAFAQNHSHASDDGPAVKSPGEHQNDGGTPTRRDGDANPNPGPAPRPPHDDVVQKPADRAPPTPEKDEPIFTSEGMEMFYDLKSVVPTTDVPATFKLHELDEEAVRKKLLAEFQQKDALRLELPVGDGNRAFERLQAVLKAHHIDLTIDATAQRRLANAKARTNYVLYGEDLTADELAQLLQQLGGEDRKAGEKKAGDGLFDALVVRRMTERDHKELADLLGVDPMQTQPKETGPLGVDPRKPLSDLTGAQIAASLEKVKPGAKAAAEHPMLVLPYNPVRPRHDSTEIKHFLDERKPLRPGALPILLVVRGPTTR
jgi:hypothetical protein